MDAVTRVVKDRHALGLVARTLGDGEVGLPIGSLTSQWLANLVLDRLDHHVKEVMCVPGYARYMDDFVLFADDKVALRSAHDEIEDMLQGVLFLELKERATMLAPTHCGLPFLGWRLYPGMRRLRPENLRRTRRRFDRRERQHARGLIDETTLAACTRSMIEHLGHGSALALRRRWFHPP
jgi:hypothetical protein